MSRISAAAAAGLSVGDYVDVTYNVAGATQGTIDGMSGLGVFSAPVETVLEIGPGSGRYLEKVVRKCAPARYEIYETAQAWADYLERRHRVVRQPASGSSLSDTADASIDLVHAHKVFVCTPFLITCRYWLEMLRVARLAIFISDSNNFGQGSWPVRQVKHVLDWLGLWPLANYLKTRGKGYSISEGDGLSYSYSVFNDYRLIRRHCRSVHLMNSSASAGLNPYRSASHVVLLGVK